VSEISLSDTPLQDFDIVSIHHLPRLSVLWLNNTGIGTEAFVMTIFLMANLSGSIRLRSRICHLVSLRWSLTELYIGANPRVNDDVVTPLLMLSKISRLSLVDTGVSLRGLRRLAVSVDGVGQAYPRVHVSLEWINYLSSEYRDHTQIGCFLIFSEGVFFGKRRSGRTLPVGGWATTYRRPIAVQKAFPRRTQNQPIAAGEM